MCKIAVASYVDCIVFREDVWYDYYNSRSTDLQVLCTVQRWDVDLLSARCVAVSLEQFGRFWSSVSSTLVGFAVGLPLFLVSTCAERCCRVLCLVRFYATMPKLSQQSGVSVQCVT